MTLPDGTFIEYLYDAAGRRVAKKVGGAFEQRFLHGDALGPVALVDAAGAVLDRYVYATSPSAPDYVIRVAGPQAGTHRLIKDERPSCRTGVGDLSADARREGGPAMLVTAWHGRAASARWRDPGASRGSGRTILVSDQSPALPDRSCVLLNTCLEQR